MLSNYKEKILYLILITLFVGQYSGILAQDNTLFFERYTRANGLSQNSVYAIAQDQFDFIWLATGKGLNRFDGYDFTNYYHDFEDVESISTSRVVDVKVDKWNRVWLATDGGLNYFDHEKEIFHAYTKIDNDSTSISGDRVKCILIDKAGHLWVGTRTGLNVSILPLDSLKLPTDKLKFKRIAPQLLSNKLITELFEDNNGNIWAGTIDGLNKIKKASLDVEQYFPAGKNQDLILSNHITSIIQDNSKLWIGTQNGLYILDIINNTFSNFKNHPFFETNTKANSIYSLLIDHLGQLWIGANGAGLLQYNPETNDFTVNKNDESNVHSLSNNAAFALFEDRSNNLFVSMFGLGFCITTIKACKFNLYLNESYNQDKSTNNDVRSILYDKDNLWLGMQNNGLIKLNLKNKEYTHFKLSQIKQNGILPTVKCIYLQDSANLWLGTLTRGLFLFNKNNKTIKEYKYKDKNIEKTISFVFDIKKDKAGNLWIASWKDGLFKLPNGSKELLRFKNNKNDKKSLSNNNVTSIYIDDDDNIWLTTWGGGISILESGSNEFKHYRMNRKKRNSLLSDYCTAICKDKDGVYWIGTTEGLCRLNKNSDKFTQFTSNEPIFSEFIFSIEYDDNSNLWLSTELGISRFSKNTMSITNYDIADGLQGNEHYIGSSCKLPDGSLAFGGKNGLNIFNPDSIYSLQDNLQVLITNFHLKYKKIKVNKEYEGSIILKKSILLTDTLILSYKNNVLNFKFATCSYHKPKTVAYAFMLVNFENEWNHVPSDKRFATYTNLKPGNYTLLIKATNSRGIWSPRIKKLHIIIESPFWQTNSFKVFAFLLIISSVLLTFRLRTIYLVRKKNILEEEVKERTRIISEKNVLLSRQKEESVLQAEELRSISEQLQHLNTQLETEVKERTKDLNSALIKAEDAQKLISSFLANMSHELRTPMNAISGFTQLIASVEMNYTEKQKYAEIINSNIETLLMLIDNVMDVAKLHTEQYKMINSDFNLSDLFSEVYLELKNKDSLQKETVEFIYSTNNYNNLSIFSDRKAFKHIIYNLLDNALKYTELGKVEINFSCKLNNQNSLNQQLLKPEMNGKAGELKIEVSDTGVGIKKEDQAYIFDTFKKLENTKKKLFRGTGLGLALVKNLTEKLHGKLELESELNIGTKVSITIPLSYK